jgi:predicted dehydrogenase
VINPTANNSKLKLAFIGGSLCSAVGKVHSAASQLDGKWELVSGCFSRTTKVNEESGRYYNISPRRVYSDFRILLEQEQGKIDAVVVLTPTPSHHDIIKECLKHNYNIISEKAFVHTYQDAKKLSKLIKQKDHYVSVTYNYCGYPMIRELREIISINTLGKILHFEAEMPQEGYLRTNSEGQPISPQEWRKKDGNIPTLHLDLGVHLHQLIYYLTREKPLEIVADQKNFGHHNVIDYASALCRYSSNISGKISFGKTSLGFRNGLSIKFFGTKASAVWFQEKPEKITLSFADGRKETIDRGSNLHIANLLRYNRFKAGHPSGFIEAFANIYYDIARDIDNGQNSNEIFNVEIAKEGLKMMHSMTKSSEYKKWSKI